MFDLEKGTKSLDSWGRTGTAFNNQPTYGDNVSKRLPGQKANQQGKYWIGTYENRPTPQSHPGAVQWGGPQGTLTSPEFQITGILCVTVYCLLFYYFHLFHRFILILTVTVNVKGILVSLFCAATAW